MEVAVSKGLRWTRQVLKVGCLAAAAFGLAGCGEEPPPTPPPPRPAVETPPYAEYLRGLKICLDPGHGGHAARPGYKRGPTGVREAEINLRVALSLRDMLAAAGASVVMTRTEDVFLHASDGEDLRRRAEVANASQADLFVSIHHNASSRPAANFVSVWYHGEVDHSPASLDIARHLSTALIDGLNLPEHLGCPVLSDYQMYPKQGFAVLRHARVPAVLTEASFFTNPEEEQRLTDPAYNQREAQALFVGLARYAYGGLPRARLVEPAGGTVAASGDRRVVIELDDGLRSRRSWGWERNLILRGSIRVRAGDRDIGHVYEEKDQRLLTILPPTLPPGPVTLNVQFENLFKHSNTRSTINVRVPG